MTRMVRIIKKRKTGTTNHTNDTNQKPKRGENDKMETLREEAINVISKLPDSASIDDIMYRLYVIDKVRKGREAIKQGDSISIEKLKGEMETW